MFKLMWKISISQARPDQMPYSIPLLLAMFCINFSILFYLIALSAGSLSIGVWKAMLMLCLITLFTAIILQIRHFPERFIQTLSGLLASQSVILVCCIIPYIIILSFLNEMSSNVLYILGLSICSILLIIASIWLFWIYSAIFKSAMELSINTSLLIALALITLISSVFFLLS